MGSLLLVLGWWLTVFILGLAAFPIAFVALKNLPDKGYVFSKVLALILVGYFSWIFGYLAFNGATILLSFLLVLAASAVLLWTWTGKAFSDFAKKNLGYFIVVEAFFLTAFLIAGAYKMRTYEIAGTEKPMDFAFINGILSSRSMPPQDPWLSGGSISYYYFGYLIVSILCKVTQVTPGEAFNLAVALTWALAAVCAFSLGYALTRRYRYSFFSALCLAVFGNLDYWHRAIQSFQVGDLRVPYYNMPTNPGAATGLSAFFGFLFSPLLHNWDYFQASRIIPVPPSDKMINEFPAFSFFLSDLHPHVMGIPLVLLAIAFSLNLLKSTLPGLQVFSGNGAWRWTQLVLAAIVFGGLSFMNVADFPTFLGLFLLCLFFQQWWTVGDHFTLWAKSVGQVAVPLAALSVVFYLPFYAKYQSQVQGIGLVHDRTDLYYLVVIFGLFFAVLLPALVGKALKGNPDKAAKAKPVRKADLWECAVCGQEGSGRKFCGSCGGELVQPFAETTALPDEGGRAALAKIASWLSKGENGWLALAASVAALLLFNFLAVKLSTALLALLLIGFCVLALASASDSRETLFAVFLVFTGFLLIWGCEVVYVKDLFSGALYRMNSVFKYHYQAWILFSVAMAPWLKWLVENRWPQWTAWKKALWAGLAGLALLGAGLYPLLTLTARMRSSSPEMATMDGSLYYEHTFPADYEAAQWIRQNIKPIGGKVPVILQTWGGSYHQEFDVLATLTGYPTVLGWDFHEVQWHGDWNKGVLRGGDPNDTIMNRRNDVDLLYTSADLNQTKELLKKYGVDYVYVGDSERQKYKDHADSLGKFAQLGPVAWQLGSSVLYKINQ